MHSGRQHTLKRALQARLSSTRASIVPLHFLGNALQRLQRPRTTHTNAAISKLRRHIGVVKVDAEEGGRGAEAQDGLRQCDV